MTSGWLGANFTKMMLLFQQAEKTAGIIHCASVINSNPSVGPVVCSSERFPVMEIREPESGRLSRTSLKNQTYGAAAIHCVLHADNKSGSSNAAGSGASTARPRPDTPVEKAWRA
jgi:hypothetical protein